jgi:type III secretory pathway component EscV
VIVSTVVGLVALVVGLIIGWPVLVALSIIFTIVQFVMLAAKTAVERNDVKVAERLAEKQARHRRD